MRKKIIILSIFLVLCLCFVKMRTKYKIMEKKIIRHKEKKRTIEKDIPKAKSREKSHEAGRNDVSDWSAWMKAMEEKYLQRKERIKAICKKNRIKGPKYFPVGNLLVDVYHNIAFCPVQKTGTTTMFEIFNKLLPPKKRLKTTKAIPLRQNARNFFQAPIMKVMNKNRPSSNWPLWEMVPYDYNLDDISNFLKDKISLSFTFVRHPFERLVSAYKDKVIENSEKHITRSLKDQSFKSFVQLVIQEYKTSLMNVHWRPIYQKCRHCDISYDVVGHTSTMEEDLRYIILKSNLEKILPLKDTLAVHAHQTHHNNDVTLKYISKLSTKEINTLYQIYKNDFDLFHFSHKMIR